MNDFKRKLRFFWQRLTRGWDDSETLSLDHSLAALIAPRLKRFKQLIHGHPADMTEQEWNDKLDKMIASFEWACSDARWDEDCEAWKTHQEGFDLFGKYYLGLWW